MPVLEHLEGAFDDPCIVRVDDINLGRLMRRDGEPVREERAGVHGGHEARRRVRRNARGQGRERGRKLKSEETPLVRSFPEIWGKWNRRVVFFGRGIFQKFCLTHSNSRATGGWLSWLGSPRIG